MRFLGIAVIAMPINAAKVKNGSFLEESKRVLMNNWKIKYNDNQEIKRQFILIKPVNKIIKSNQKFYLTNLFLRIIMTPNIV